MASEHLIPLMSDAKHSASLHPHNTAAHFTTQLFYPVELPDGQEYEMALKEIQFPVSFYNVQPDTCYVGLYVEHPLQMLNFTNKIYHLQLREMEFAKRKKPISRQGREAEETVVAVIQNNLNNTEMVEDETPRKKRNVGNQPIYVVDGILPDGEVIVEGAEFQMFADANIVSMDVKGGLHQSVFKAHTFMPGNYTNIHRILKEINSADLLIQHGIRMSYDELTGHMSTHYSQGGYSNKSKDGYEAKFTMSKKLRLMLGYEYDQIEVPAGIAPHPVNLYRTIPQQFLVYCDLVEPRLVGDTSARLLRNVGVEGKPSFGELFVKPYDNPDYIPMLINRFQTIEISIMTNTKKFAPFEFGPSLVKVHIRKKRS